MAFMPFFTIKHFIDLHTIKTNMMVENCPRQTDSPIAC
jgi:hypothetical protein